MATNIPYFVTENFHEYQGSLGRLEAAVEDEYKTNLRYACNRERNYSKSIHINHCSHWTIQWKSINFFSQRNPCWWRLAILAAKICIEKRKWLRRRHVKNLKISSKTDAFREHFHSKVFIAIWLLLLKRHGKNTMPIEWMDLISILMLNVFQSVIHKFWIFILSKDIYPFWTLQIPKNRPFLTQNLQK